MNKKFYLSTPLFLGIILFALLVLTPTLKRYFQIKAPYLSFVEELPTIYDDMKIPVIMIQDGEIRSNNDQLFSKELKNNNQKGNYHIFIDTSESPDLTLKSKIRSESGGIVIYRNEIVIFDSNKQREQTIPLHSIPPDFKFTLDKSFVKKISNKYKNHILMIVTLSIALFYLISKLFWWLVISLFFSSKAKLAGGSAYSIALWSLVLPTMVQTLMPTRTPCCCLTCGIYYIVLFTGVYFLQAQLKPIKHLEE